MIIVRSRGQRGSARTKGIESHHAFSPNRILGSVNPLRSLQSFIVLLWLTASCQAQSAAQNSSSTNIFAPSSTPADSIYKLSLLVLAVTGTIFVVVLSLLVYAAVKFKRKSGDDREPPQIYGSDQLELAWTVLPVLIVMVLCS